jgi:hypothetical protein
MLLARLIPDITELSVRTQIDAAVIIDEARFIAGESGVDGERIGVPGEGEVVVGGGMGICWRWR